VLSQGKRAMKQLLFWFKVESDTVMGKTVIPR